MAYFSVVSSSRTDYKAFTPVGQSGNTAATNFTPNKYYIIGTQEGSSEPTTVSGAIIISKLKMSYANTWSFFVMATASTISMSGGGTGGAFAMPIEIG